MNNKNTRRFDDPILGYIELIHIETISQAQFNSLKCLNKNHRYIRNFPFIDVYMIVDMNHV